MVHDVVTIGFGPSGLALAVALEEQGALDRALFLERKPAFSWHEGMLLEGARIQVSFLKDLATLRDPTSRFTFLSFLKRAGRLDEFINMSTLRPSRVEFDAYLRWAADEVGSSVRYGAEVTAVEPVRGEGGTVAIVRVRARDAEGHEDEHLARNVVLAAGGVPRVPDGVQLAGSARLFHSRDFLVRIAAHDTGDGGEGRRFAVVGDGQSAAEIFDVLAARFPRADVVATTRGIGYRPMDETPFVNEIFFPRAVDAFYGLSPEKRRTVLARHRNANYGVVDADLIERLYRRIYDARVAGGRTLEIRPFLTLVAATDDGAGVRLTYEDWLHDRSAALEADVVVLATGYTMPNPHPLLGPLLPHLEAEADGRLRVDRGYRVAGRDGFAPGVFVQGYAQGTHGIGDTLLSLSSIRAAEIARSLTAPVPTI